MNITNHLAALRQPRSSLHLCNRRIRIKLLGMIVPKRYRVRLESKAPGNSEDGSDIPQNIIFKDVTLPNVITVLILKAQIAANRSRINGEVLYSLRMYRPITNTHKITCVIQIAIQPPLTIRAPASESIIA